jgi:hypothetical protein
VQAISSRFLAIRTFVLPDSVIAKSTTSFWSPIVIVTCVLSRFYTVMGIDHIADGHILPA